MHFNPVEAAGMLTTLQSLNGRPALVQAVQAVQGVSPYLNGVRHSVTVDGHKVTHVLLSRAQGTTGHPAELNLSSAT